MVQWLRLHACTAGGMGLIPGQGTKILHALQHGGGSSFLKDNDMKDNDMFSVGQGYYCQISLRTLAFNRWLYLFFF